MRMLSGKNTVHQLPGDSTSGVPDLTLVAVDRLSADINVFPNIGTIEADVGWTVFVSAFHGFAFFFWDACFLESVELLLMFFHAISCFFSGIHWLI